MTKLKKTTIKNSEKKNKEEGQTVLVSSSESFFDDCPICQAMNEEQKSKGN